MDEHSGDNYSEQLSAKILFLFAFEFGTEQEKNFKVGRDVRGAVAERATLANTFSSILGALEGTKRHMKGAKAQ